MTHDVIRRHVIGVDASLTRTGLAAIRATNGGGIAWADTTAVVSRGTLRDTVRQRSARLDELTDGVLEYVRDVDERGRVLLAVIEGPSFGSSAQYGHMWDRGGLWHSIVRGLHRLGIPVVQVAPKTRAKYACGNGNGGKAAVMAGLREVWPAELVRKSDEADALVCAAIGGHALGWKIPEPAPGRAAAAVAAVDWSDADPEPIR